MGVEQVISPDVKEVHKNGENTLGVLGVRFESNSLPATFNIEKDPREEDNLVVLSGWTYNHYLSDIGEHMQSLEKYPNPASANLTGFKK